MLKKYCFKNISFNLLAVWNFYYACKQGCSGNCVEMYPGVMKDVSGDITGQVSAEYSRTNPFYKCGDDEIRMYDWIHDTTKYYSVKYKVGTMMVMPSFLLHSSEVNLSDERKRVISWDMRVE